jgi:RimJ/RimL family protein N-acetyltransferase
MFEEVRNRHFPAEIVPGIIAKAVDDDKFDAVISALADQVFAPLESVGNYETPPERYSRADPLVVASARAHWEQIVFYDQERPVGWSMGVMHDSSTFFMRWSGVLPAYQRRGIYAGFLRVFLPYLHDLGYERATSNHMVNNRAVLIAKLKAGFIITGMVLDERYGAQVTLSYFFYEDRREGFARAYSTYSYPGTPDYHASLLA